jgi:hypothetical protein
VTRPAVACCARAGWGAALVIVPRRMLTGCGSPPDGLAAGAVRVLGFRHLAQAAWAFRRESGPGGSGAGGALDCVHAASMALLAVRRPDYRRAALVSLGVSLSLAIAAQS